MQNNHDGQQFESIHLAQLSGITGGKTDGGGGHGGDDGTRSAKIVGKVDHNVLIGYAAGRLAGWQPRLLIRRA
jgi:hypothetical protein